LTALPTVNNKLVSPYPNSVTAIDQMSVNGYIVQKTREFISFSAIDNVNVLPYAQLKVTKVSEKDTVNVNFVGGISVQTYLLGVPICLPPANNAPVSSISGAINEGVESSIEMCLEIENVMGDSVSASASVFSSGILPGRSPVQYTQQDAVTASTSVFSSGILPAQYTQQDDVQLQYQHIPAHLHHSITLINLLPKIMTCSDNKLGKGFLKVRAKVTGFLIAKIEKRNTPEKIIVT